MLLGEVYSWRDVSSWSRALVLDWSQTYTHSRLVPYSYIMALYRYPSMHDTLPCTKLYYVI